MRKVERHVIPKHGLIIRCLPLSASLKRRRHLGSRYPIRVRLLVALVLCTTLAAAPRQVAITIDDLPRSGDGGPLSLPALRDLTAKLLKPLREQRVPVIGFVNAGRARQIGAPGLREILDLWLDSGADLGNHTYSHLNINQVPFSQYTADILKGEPILSDALAAHHKKLEFFRHPFLFTGATPETKRALQEFLDGHGYRVAPVTLDNNDYQFASLYNRPAYHERVALEYVPYMESIVEFFERRSVEVVGREISQILLIHASQLNADLMPSLLEMFRRRGYRFVSLAQALSDDAYRLPDQVPARNGISWLHRWAATKGMPPRMEPPSPSWIQ